MDQGYKQSYLVPYAEIIILSDLIERCNKKEIKENLNKISKSPTALDELTKSYDNAIGEMKGPWDIKRVLGTKNTIDKILKGVYKVKPKI